MSLTAKGSGGEIRVGGRIAATLSTWSLETIGPAWICSAEATELVETLLDYGGSKELRLNVGTETVWRFKGVDVVPSGTAITISGTSHPEKG